MPSLAESDALPTSTVRSRSSGNRTSPPSVAVTRTVLAPPSSASSPWSPGVPVSASTVSVTAGALSSSLMVAVPSRVLASLAKTPFFGEDSRSTTVSLPSKSLSPMTDRGTVCSVDAPGAPTLKVSVPAVSAT